MRIISLLLVLVMLFSFAACQNDPVDPVDSDSGEESTTPEETTTADTMDVQTGAASYNAADYLPQETFDGEDIHIWIDGADTTYDVPEERYTEGDIVHDAVLERNQKIMDTYDVVLNWNQDWVGGYRDKAQLRQSILAGDEYDIVGGPTLYINPQIVYGCYYDLSQNEYVDLSQPWWMQEACESQRVFDRQFTAVGYFDMMTIKRIAVMYFSDPMVLDYRLGDLYDVVDAGEWTWEKMLEFSEIVSEDVNQDGIYDDADKYGVSGRWDFWCIETTTMGYQYVSRDENGDYVVTGVTDDLLKIHEKVYPFITESNQYFSRYTYGVHPRYPAEVNNTARTMFTNNQILFFHEHLSWSGSDALRNYGEYGILPSPKYLDTQEDYACASTAYVSAICTTTGDMKISSIILEALQLESYNIVRPAYTVDALSYKYLSDPQAVAMLNLIFSNVTSEWAYNFSQAGVGSELNSSLATQKYLGSHFQKNKNAMEAKLADFVASVSNMPT